MNERNKRIAAELIQFQTLGFQCKCLVNHFSHSDCMDENFLEFQSRVFTIVDKVSNGNLKFSAKEIVFINNIKKLIIERYKQESLMAEMINNNSELNEMFDKKIVEIHDLFSVLKELEV